MSWMVSSPPMELGALANPNVVHKTEPTNIATAQIRLLAVFFITWTMGNAPLENLGLTRKFQGASVQYVTHKSKGLPNI